jgi:hypothetical protein
VKQIVVFLVRFVYLKHFFGLFDVAFTVAAVAEVDEGSGVVAVRRPRVLGITFGLFEVALQDV